ncbi:tRNA pseudouridine32 synthase [Nematocida sp. AWRm80]|nr:tRNA pseudouridine32 synthase [Nematocida sp. AWRm80]
MSHTVPPYYYTYKANVKERWIGREIVSVLSEEFKRRSKWYFILAVIAGSITVNGQKVHPEYRLRSQDLIEHIMHRHEPPVPTDQIDILHRESTLIVVDKPAGMPCHPNSGYNKNTLTEILKERYSLQFISVANRLDRQTSGVVILPLSPETAKEYHQIIERKTEDKLYLARVKGTFPIETVIVNLPLAISRNTCLTTIHQTLTNNQTNTDSQSQENKEDKSTPLAGKQSITLFKRVALTDNESIVLCKPVTGRTHQIRVHLQAIGYPITGDQIYSNEYIPAESIASLIDKDTNRIEVTEDKYKLLCNHLNVSLTEEDITKRCITTDCRTDEYKDSDETLNSCDTSSISAFVNDSCLHCRNNSNLDKVPVFSSLCLHAWAYLLKENVFMTRPPEWSTLPVDTSLEFIRNTGILSVTY